MLVARLLFLLYALKACSCVLVVLVHHHAIRKLTPCHCLSRVPMLLCTCGDGTAIWYLCIYTIYISILRRIGKNKAYAHHKVTVLAPALLCISEGRL